MATKPTPKMKSPRKAAKPKPKATNGRGAGADRPIPLSVAPDSPLAYPVPGEHGTRARVSGEIAGHVVRIVVEASVEDLAMLELTGHGPSGDPWEANVKPSADAAASVSTAVTAEPSSEPARFPDVVGTPHIVTTADRKLSVTVTGATFDSSAKLEMIGPSRTKLELDMAQRDAKAVRGEVPLEKLKEGEWKIRLRQAGKQQEIGEIKF
jgi:hypothetical protein